MVHLNAGLRHVLGDASVPDASGSPCCSAAAELLLRWNCCGCWRRLKERVLAVVSNPFFDLGIVVCIIMDVLFMAMEHFPMTVEYQDTLTIANLVGVRGNSAGSR